MTRPTRIANEQILEAARKRFLSEGLAASTLDIAKDAGVSEGLLFKRFGTKETLFLTCMGGGGAPPWLALLRESDEPLRRRVETLGVALVEFFRELIPRMSMLWSSRSPKEIFKGSEEPPPLKALSAITAFFERYEKTGEIRRGTAPIAARVVLSGAQSYAFFEMIGVKSAIDADEFVKRLVGVLWSGVSPEPGRKTGKKSKSTKSRRGGS